MNYSENALTTKQSAGSRNLSSLLTNALYGFFFTENEYVLATHRELMIMRQCSKYLCNRPERIVRVLMGGKREKNRFIENTLLHLGVSCNNIHVDDGFSGENPAGGVWLLIEERTAN